LIALCAAVVVMSGCAAQRSPAAQPAATRTGSAVSRDTHEGLQGVLWVQSSAEFRVLTETTYARAKTLLGRAAADPSWTAAIEQEGRNYASLPSAVVMDLDETVLDNSLFQGQLVRDHREYSAELWSEWVQREAAASIPGAADFVKFARSQGVRVVFITNRTAQEEPATVRNLEALLGARQSADDVLSSGENGWPSDKTSRRAFVATTNRIVLLVGDDLNDFVSVAGARTADDRVSLATQHSSKWQDRWILLPNPLYGSWDRIISSGVSTDPEVLQRKRQTVKGFKSKD
jgi:acid phosphatase